jgi:hypothetical protein
LTNPWENEPDQEAFKCGDVIGAVQRKPAGYLCGYVALPEDHDLYGVDFSDVHEGFHPHGGWTFSAPVEMEGRRMWVLGFDASHGFDYNPGLNKPTGMPDAVLKLLERIGSTMPGPESYRTFDYMREQAQRAALSLARIESPIEMISPKLLP